MSIDYLKAHFKLYGMQADFDVDLYQCKNNDCMCHCVRDKYPSARRPVQIFHYSNNLSFVLSTKLLKEVISALIRLE